MSNPESTSISANSQNRPRPVLGRESLNAPNLVTGIRLLLSIVLFTMIAAGGWWIASAALFVIAASTDALDGY